MKNRISDEINKDMTGLSVDSIFERMGVGNTAQIPQRSLLVNLSNNISSFYGLDEWIRKERPEVSRRHIRLSSKQKSRESLLIGSLDFIKTAQETWEVSSLRELFRSRSFLFFVFEDALERGQEHTYFRGMFEWKLLEDVVDEVVKSYWTRVHTILNEGVALEEKPDGRTLNNLPKSSDSPLMHVRPQAKNKADTARLPDGRYLTKQAHWLNARFFDELVKYHLPPLEIKEAPRGSHLEQPNKLTKPLYHINDLLVELKVPKDEIMQTGYKGYKWEQNFLISKQYGSIQDYIESSLLNGPYVSAKTLESYQGDWYLNDRILRMISMHKLVKVDENRYITEIGLMEKGYTPDDIRKDVELALKTLGKNSFFSWQHFLEEQAVEKYAELGKLYHVMNGLLDNIPVLMKIKFGDGEIYAFSKKDTVNRLVKIILGNSERMNMEAFVDEMVDRFGVLFEHGEVEKLLIKQYAAYSSQLYMVFKDQEAMYRYIYR